MPSDETISNPLNPRRRRISAESFSAGKSVLGVVQNQFVLNTKIIKSLSVVGDRVDNKQEVHGGDAEQVDDTRQDAMDFLKPN